MTVRSGWVRDPKDDFGKLEQILRFTQDDKECMDDCFKEAYSSIPYSSVPLVIPCSLLIFSLPNSQFPIPFLTLNSTLFTPHPSSISSIISSPGFTSTLSIRWPSMSITSKEKPRHSSLSPVLGMRSSSLRMQPARVSNWYSSSLCQSVLLKRARKS